MLKYLNLSVQNLQKTFVNDQMFVVIRAQPTHAQLRVSDVRAFMQLVKAPSMHLRLKDAILELLPDWPTVVRGGSSLWSRADD